MARVPIRSHTLALILLCLAGTLVIAQVGTVGVPGRQPANPVIHPGGGTYGGPGDIVPPGGSGTGSGNPCFPPPVCAADSASCASANSVPGVPWEEVSAPCVTVGGDLYEAYGVNLTLGALKDLCDDYASGALAGIVGPGGTLKICYTSTVGVQQVHVFESSWLTTACYLHGACGAVPVRVCINGQSFHNGTIGSAGLGWGGFGCDQVEVCLVLDMDCLCCAINAIYNADPFADPDKWLFHVGFVSCFPC